MVFPHHALIVATLYRLNRRSRVTPGRYNLLAVLKGRKPGPSMIYNGHLDVVPAGSGWSWPPFGGKIADGRLYGRGAADMKSGVAAMLYAAVVLKRLGLPFAGEIILFFNVDEEAIQAMLDAAGLEPDDEITFIEHRKVSVTAEKAAINAVMAGCKPEYMPVIVGAIEGIGDSRYNYHGPSTSTGGSAVFLLVNGPIAKALEINHGDNLFGPGWRANATIGRAVRLVMRNVIGTMPGKLDRSTLGHGGKYTFCIAEDEEKSPWLPVHVERGFKPEQSTATVFGLNSRYQVGFGERAGH